MLGEKKLDKSVPIPLYFQLKTLLLDAIKRGDYPVNGMIPTEKELSEMFGISRTTVRQAVNSVDWGELIDFTLLKTIPFFWIPVNTITFLLPEEYRIASAAMLSMVFGILMTVLRLKERRDQASTAAQ